MTSSSANLTIIPALSPFVNFIAKSIDTKNNIFAKIGCGLRVDRLINLCAQACFPITNEMMGQFTMIPSDAQLIVLNHVDSLHKWVHVQTLCHDKNVVEESIRPYLSALKISKKSNNIEEAFLGRVFDQLIINSNA
ncbi:MAG: hypothetical protein JHC93_03750, partial [Parachlamydiales bacterium]|nr:hypothetical protein [Parachlamydiales bacterium]